MFFFQSVHVVFDYGFFFFQCALMLHYHINTFVIFSPDCFAHSTYVSKFMFFFIGFFVLLLFVPLEYVMDLYNYSFFFHIVLQL